MEDKAAKRDIIDTIRRIKVTIEAPEIFQNGNVTTRGQGGGSGTVDETANRTQRGNLTIEGNLSVSGNIDCSGTSTAARRRDHRL